MRPGLTELEIAGQLEGHLRRLGSEAHPFPTIVASGPRSALPHARSSRRPVGKGEWLLFDFGAVVDGYCADITRTVVVGARASEAQRALYDVVRDAQRRAREGVRAGMSGADADALARDVIDASGLYVDGAYLTFTPDPGRDLHLLAGKIPWAIGTWAPRTYSNRNPLVGAPLMYQYHSTLSWYAIPGNADALIAEAGAGQFGVGYAYGGFGMPLIDDSYWDVGVTITGSQRPLEYALGMTAGTPGWGSTGEDENSGKTVLGRVGIAPLPGLRLGASAAYGPYLLDALNPFLPAGKKATDYRQRLGMADVELLAGHRVLVPIDQRPQRALGAREPAGEDPGLDGRGVRLPIGADELPGQESDVADATAEVQDTHPRRDAGPPQRILGEIAVESALALEARQLVVGRLDRGGHLQPRGHELRFGEMVDAGRSFAPAAARELVDEDAHGFNSQLTTDNSEPCLCDIHGLQGSNESPNIFPSDCRRIGTIRGQKLRC